MIVPILKGLWDFVGESNLLWITAPKLIAAKIPHHRKLGYERRPHFRVLESLNGPTDFPIISRMTSAEAKIELHEARKAGDHLDFRIKVGNRVYDFAIVKTTSFPEKTGVLRRVQRTPNHSLRYFYTDNAEFPEGTYGHGTMRTAWRGKIDIIEANAQKVEFCIPEGPFAGRFCLRELNQGWVLLRMREPDLPWKDRMDYTAVKGHIDKAYENPDIIAEHKIDGANYMVIPGPKENVVISRRLSVDGNPINRANNIPQLKYHQFPKELHGKVLHCEVTADGRSSSFTAGLLNSRPLTSRATQQATCSPLVGYIWDVGDKRASVAPYTERRALATATAAKVGKVDGRAFGCDQDRFLLRRLVRPRLLQVPTSNVDTGETPRKFAERLKAEGEEGVVLKDKTKGYYQDRWAKDKKVETLDLVIRDFQEGVGKHSGRLGALVCADPKTGAVTKVGTGFTDSQREAIWALQSSLRGKLVCVDTHEVTHNGVGRGPRWVGFHPESGVVIQDEQGLRDYAEGAAISPYQVKSAAGWRKK